MKTSSAKAKGRRASVEACNLIMKHIPEIEPGDLYATPAGVTGEDIVRSAKAKRILPFAFELKNQEKLNIWQAIEQSKGHVADHDERTIPVVVFRRNRSDLHICLKFDDFLKVYASGGIEPHLSLEGKPKP